MVCEVQLSYKRGNRGGANPRAERLADANQRKQASSLRLNEEIVL